MSRWAHSGPAFPVNVNDENAGMTLRDWFAGQALSGIMAGATGTSNRLEWAPEEAYAMADAMLAVRDESGGAQ
jgi:hypothetical protein